MAPPFVLFSKTLLHHDGYVVEGGPGGKLKQDRNMPLLEKMLEENPKNLRIIQECIESSRSVFERDRYVRMDIEGVEQRWSKPREQLPLSQQNEFKAIKNMVIREAERMQLGEFTFEDEQMDDELDEEENAPTSQIEVKEKLKVAIAEGQRLDISKAGNYTVAAWVRTWYEVYAEPRIRPNTKEYYTNYIENHIVPGIGKIMLDKLTTIQIQRFYNNLQKNGRVQRKGFPELKDKSLSPRVVRGVHTLLSNCLDQAVA